MRSKDKVALYRIQEMKKALNQGVKLTTKGLRPSAAAYSYR